jgi:hypothetical protein
VHLLEKLGLRACVTGFRDNEPSCMLGIWKWMNRSMSCWYAVFLPSEFWHSYSKCLVSSLILDVYIIGIKCSQYQVAEGLVLAISPYTFLLAGTTHLIISKHILFVPTDMYVYTHPQFPHTTLEARQMDTSLAFQFQQVTIKVPTTTAPGSNSTTGTSVNDIQNMIGDYVLTPKDDGLSSAAG